ncbi:nickel-dependent hydrogenase large subunit [Methylocaldum gracile subsp. desertum]|uniref:nickel-dependent hydrogenase large subunit n=1 Tax=Methylocaldum sp. GT1BW TaxID=3438964 RepID=UPI003DA0096F
MSTNIGTAELLIRCGISSETIVSVSITPRPLLPVERLALGKPPEAVPTLFGRLFSLCPKAHAKAAARALEDALDISVSPNLERPRDLQTTVERVRELSLNLLLASDGRISPWPPRLITLCRRLIAALGGDAVHWPAAPFEPNAAELRVGATELEALVSHLLGGLWHTPQPDLEAVRHWLEHDTCAAVAWMRPALQPGWPDFGRCAVDALPAFSDPMLKAALGPGSMRVSPTCPEWDELPRETGCLVRQSSAPLIREALAVYGNGLFTRMLARMVELKSLVRSLIEGIEQLAPIEPGSLPGRTGGIGVAQTEAARGRLIHRVEVADGRVCDYRILAPTDWNFHPRGLVYRALLGAAVGDADSAKARIEAFLRVVDPCVDHRLILEPAERPVPTPLF